MTTCPYKETSFEQNIYIYIHGIKKGIMLCQERDMRGVLPHKTEDDIQFIR